jgi:hypothetical protein
LGLVRKPQREEKVSWEVLHTAIRYIISENSGHQFSSLWCITLITYTVGRLAPTGYAIMKVHPACLNAKNAPECCAMAVLTGTSGHLTGPAGTGGD